MIFWSSIIVIAFILAIVFFILNKKNEWWNIGQLLGFAFSLGFAFIMLLAVCGETMSYRQFETSLEIQREYIEEIAAADPNADLGLVYVADMIEANKQLADYQARRQVWGFASIIPERVFDIEPIGAS